MKMLELFSGSGRMSSYFRKLGYETYTVEYNESLEADLHIDINDLTYEMILENFGNPDVIWASPPCTAFSVASIGHHWTGGTRAYIPKTEFASKSIELLKHTKKLIEQLNPKIWFIENPRGIMRKLDILSIENRNTITYCQYGDTRMKPTDIWTNHPYPNFRPMCSPNDTCHESAPRGSSTGTQGLKDNYERSLIPHEFCEYVAKLSNNYINGIINYKGYQERLNI